MISVGIKFEDKGLRAYLAGVERRANNTAGLLRPVGPYLVKTAKDRFPVSGPGWLKPLLRRGKALYDTHGLQKTLTYEVKGNTLTVGSKDIRAGVLNGQYGPWYTMRARNKKYMRIPNPEYFKTDKAMREADPRLIPGLFFVKGGAGESASLCVSTPDRRYKGGSKLQVVFFLRKMVKIPARPFIFWAPGQLKGVVSWMVDYIVRGKKGASGLPIWNYVTRLDGE